VNGLLDQKPLDLRDAERRLLALGRRTHELIGLGLVLAAVAAFTVVVDPSGPGVPIAIGAVSAFGLAALRRADRRKLLAQLVVQGDALAITEVKLYAQQLTTARERRRLADGLRMAVASVGQGAHVTVMVNAPRVDDFAPRLLGIAEAISDQAVSFNPQALALCGQMLHDPMRSPLCNPHVPERELPRILELVERGRVSSA
jgi:hypothetical protein